MPSIVSRRWSGEEQTTLRRAAADPDFQLLIIEYGFSIQSLKHWLNEQDVPVTYRADIRTILSAWSYGRASA